MHLTLQNLSLNIKFLKALLCYTVGWSVITSVTDIPGYKSYRAIDFKLCIIVPETLKFRKFIT